MKGWKKDILCKQSIKSKNDSIISCKVTSEQRKLWDRGTLCNDEKINDNYVSTIHKSFKTCEANTAKLKKETDKYKYLEIWTLFFNNW